MQYEIALFMCRRQLLKSHAATTGIALLYFGCRGPSEDFLYRSDLESFEADGTLSRLELAFSRDGQNKAYVQHRMKQQVSLCCSWNKQQCSWIMS